ncbi:DUF262 domain-containing protein [Halobaculum halobium]|uniref:GmrSD restriction endonuclease domain-containing protein n=1 Tax=Halobaculum halobium TaxID=3032281 RepID=UPI00361B2B7A
MWETVREILSLQSTSGQKPSDTYFGTVYVAKSPKQDNVEVIDGQQRLSTFAILLHNLGKKLDEKIPEVSGELSSYAEHVRDIYIDELLYRQQGPKEVPFLQLNDHDNAFFEALFSEDEDVVKSVVEKMDQYDGRKTNAIQLKELLEEFEVDEEVYSEVGLDTDNGVLIRSVTTPNRIRNS